MIQPSVVTHGLCWEGSQLHSRPGGQCSALGWGGEVGKGLCSISWGFLGLLAKQIVLSLNLVLFLFIGSCPSSWAGLTSAHGPIKSENQDHR